MVNDLFIGQEIAYIKWTYEDKMEIELREKEESEGE
jgi:hypothetical protein